MDENSLYFYYQNVHGLNTGITDFITEINCHNFDKIVLTESWFKQDKNISHSCQVVIRYIEVMDSFNPIWKLKGGGLCLLITKEIQVHVIMVKVGHISGKGLPQIFLALHYFSTDLKPGIMQEYIWFVNKFINKKVKIILWVLQNPPSNEWITGNITSNHYYIRQNVELILELANLLNLSQVNRSYFQNDHIKILDVLLTNLDSGKIHSQVAALTTIDHFHPLYCQ